MFHRRVVFIVLFLTVCVAVSGQPRTSSSSSSPTGATHPTLRSANALVQSGEFDAAVAELEAITAANPGVGGAWFLLGYAHHAAGRFAEAIPNHRRAAGFPQSRGSALYNLGCAHAQLGQSDEAFDALRRSIDAGFGDLGLMESDAELAKLHDDERWEAMLSRLRAAAERPARRAMDFWVGQWDCYSPNGVRSGTNTLESENNGLFVHEQWTSNKGSIGQSFNFYDIERGEWTQIWIDNGRQLTMHAPPDTPGELLFEGRNTDQAGVVTYRRMHVKSLPGGRVAQHGMTSPDGESWSTSYRLVYVPKGEPFDASDLPPAIGG